MSSVNLKDQEYLLSRGYTVDLIKSEPICSFDRGPISYGLIDLEIVNPVIGFISHSPSGHLIGITTRRVEEKEYRWFQSPKALHLPIFYATKDDHEKLFETGDLILSEGVFDRVALKRAFPDRAVYARLTKGTGNQLVHYLKRYAKRLWLAFDMDEPGQKATERTEKKLKDHMDVNSIDFAANDPAKLLERVGLGRFRELTERQITPQEI